MSIIMGYTKHTQKEPTVSATATKAAAKKQQDVIQALLADLAVRITQSGVSNEVEGNDAAAVLYILAGECLTAVTNPYAEPTEQIQYALRQTLSRIDMPSAQDAKFIMGGLHVLLELCAIARNQKIPARTADILVRSVIAQQIASAVLSRRSLSPSQIADMLGKNSQNLVPIEKEMVEAGLLRRDEFGKSVRYSPTPLLESCSSVISLPSERIPEKQDAAASLVVDQSVEARVVKKPRRAGIKCSEFINELTDYLDGQISDSLRMELDEHLHWCHNCRVVVNTTKKAIQICLDNRLYPLGASIGSFEHVPKLKLGKMRDAKRDAKKEP
jgi:hypothetical protein